MFKQPETFAFHLQVFYLNCFFFSFFFQSDGSLRTPMLKTLIDLYRCRHRIRTSCGIICNQNRQSMIIGWNLFNCHICQKSKWRAPIRNLLNKHYRIWAKNRRPCLLICNRIVWFNKFQIKSMHTNMCLAGKVIGADRWITIAIYRFTEWPPAKQYDVRAWLSSVSSGFYIHF